MTKQVRYFIILGLFVILLVALVKWRDSRDQDITSSSSVLPPLTAFESNDSSPLARSTPPTIVSPIAIPTTALAPITVATLQAIRATRSTATPPAPSDLRLPYIAPETWRRWAIRILGIAGILTYIGLRLRRNQ